VPRFCADALKVGRGVRSLKPPLFHVLSPGGLPGFYALNSFRLCDVSPLRISCTVAHQIPPPVSRVVLWPPLTSPSGPGRIPEAASQHFAGVTLRTAGPPQKLDLSRHAAGISFPSSSFFVAFRDCTHVPPGNSTCSVLAREGDFIKRNVRDSSRPELGLDPGCEFRVP